MVEFKVLAASTNHFISPRNSKNIIFLIQDGLYGIHTVSQDDVKFTREQFIDIVTKAPSFNPELPRNNTNEYTGKDLVSQVMANVNIGENVKGGLLKKGVLTKGLAEQVAQATFNEYGPDATKNYIVGLQRMMDAWLSKRGASASLGDLMVPLATQKRIEEAIRSGLSRVEQINKDIEDGRFVAPLGLTPAEHYEQVMKGILNSISGAVLQIINEALDKKSNNIRIMVDSKSKGSDVNIVQMIGFVGQQAISGNRISESYEMRSFPHYPKFQNSPESRGFVAESFYGGLSPISFFCHAAGGREGLIDTSLKTARSGYISRRLIKAMEDILVCYDMTVRKQNGAIIQFIYGGDGIAPSKLESLNLEILGYNNKQMEDLYSWSDFVTGSKQEAQLLYEEYNQLFQDRDTCRAIFSTFKKNEGEVKLPVHVKRIIANAKGLFGESGTQKATSSKTSSVEEPLTPSEVVTMVRTLCEELPWLFKSPTEYIKKNTPVPIIEIYRAATTLLCIYIRSHLASKRVIKEHKLNKAAFDYVLSEIRIVFLKSIVNPGEMIGALTSHSIAEQITQLTLNTFHLAGHAEKSNVNQGVPRIGELLDCTANLATPYCTIFIKEGADNLLKAKEIMNKIEYNIVKDFVKSVGIHDDPDAFESSVVEEDRAFIKDYFKYTPGASIPSHVSRTVIRLEFNKDDMIYKQMRMAHIERKIRQKYQMVFIISSDDNAEKLVMRIHLLLNKVTDKNKQELELIYKYKDRILYEVALRGVKGITGVDIKKDNISSYDPVSGDITKREEFFFYTNGTNLQDVLSLPGIDTTRSISNDITEIARNLGIEAARRALMNEMSAVFESSGAEVSIRHLYVLADLMTQKGVFIPINRTGMKRSDNGFLQKAAFEELQNVFVQAAVNAEHDEMKGVSGRLITCEPFRGGTNAFTLIWDDSDASEGIAMEEIEELLN